MLTREETSMPWLTVYAPVAVAIVILGCCLLATLPNSDDKSGPASHIASDAASSDAASRAEQSDTAFLIDALKSSGKGEDDKAVQRALAFVSRCRNQKVGHDAPP